MLIHGFTIASLKLALISVRPDACKSIANTIKVACSDLIHDNMPFLCIYRSESWTIAKPLKHNSRVLRTFHNLWQQHTTKGDISAHKICLLRHPVAAARRRPNQDRPDNEGHTGLQTACRSQKSSTTAADTEMMMIDGE